MIFCNTSSQYCHWFGAPSSTRTILTHATESIKRLLKQSGTGEHDAHEEADRAGYFRSEKRRPVAAYNYLTAGQDWKMDPASSHKCTMMAQEPTDRNCNTVNSKF